MKAVNFPNKSKTQHSVFQWRKFRKLMAKAKGKNGQIYWPAGLICGIANSFLCLNWLFFSGWDNCGTFSLQRFKRIIWQNVYIISSTIENKWNLFNGYVLPVMINELRRRLLSRRLQRPWQWPNLKWREWCSASRYVAGREIHGFDIRLKSRTLSRSSRKKKK